MDFQKTVILAAALAVVACSPRSQGDPNDRTSATTEPPAGDHPAYIHGGRVEPRRPERRATGRPIYRVRYTEPESPLTVIRVIAPGLEHFGENRKRIGSRLEAAIEASARAAMSRSMSMSMSMSMSVRGEGTSQ